MDSTVCVRSVYFSLSCLLEFTREAIWVWSLEVGGSVNNDFKFFHRHWTISIFCFLLRQFDSLF